MGKTSVPFAIDSESDRFKNCYPGARVDSDTPIYQLFDKELWSTFTFKERYAGWRELRRYFEHVEKVLALSQLSHLTAASASFVVTK